MSASSKRRRSEIWLPIPGWVGEYEASDRGRIRSLDRCLVTMSRHGTPMTCHLKGRVLVLSVDERGRPKVTLRRFGRTRTYHVSRLVLLAFRGFPPDDSMVAAHNSGDVADNSLGNLRWTTQADNIADKVRHGTHLLGEKVPTAKLSIVAVRAIREAGGSVSVRELARRYVVGSTAIYSVRNGKTWRHVDA